MLTDSDNLWLISRPELLTSLSLLLETKVDLKRCLQTARENTARNEPLGERRCSGNALHSYSGGTWLESRLGHRLSYYTARTFQTIDRKIFLLGHGHFLKIPLTYWFSHRSTLYILNTGSAIK
jgi:hypothetical protein